MPLTLSQEPPREEEFVALTRHQASTPNSFFDGPPVLYHVQKGCSVFVDQDALQQSDEFRRWWGQPPDHSVNGQGATGSAARKILKQDVQVLVATSALILTSGSQQTTIDSPPSLSVTYHAVTLHATQRLDSGLVSAATLDRGPESSPDQLSALYLQIDPWHDARDQPGLDIHEGQDGYGHIEMLIVPPSTTPVENGNHSGRASSPLNLSTATAIFDALSACAELWPDEDEDEQDESGESGATGQAIALGGLELPGNGQWITAENADQFFTDADEDDSSDPAPVILGPAAGSRRSRNDDADGDDGTAGDDAKWQRTG